jgi:hypothetical protein
MFFVCFLVGYVLYSLQDQPHSLLHCARCVGGFDGGDSPPAWGFRGNAPEFFFPQETCHFFSSFFMLPRFLCPLLGGFSAHGFLSMVFYFQLRN